jgi:hypothetical protein
LDPLLKNTYRIGILWLARLVPLIAVCGCVLFVNTWVVLLFAVVALFAVTTIIDSQKVLERTFVMVQLCHSNYFGLL